MEQTQKVTTVMPLAEQMRRATEVAVQAVRALPAGRDDAPSPCAEFTVAQAFEHLAWCAVLAESAGRRQELDREWSDPAPPPFLRGVAPQERADAFAKQCARVVEAWSSSQAWEGETFMGTSPMPASVVGPLMVSEFVVHGWDVARGGGADVPVDDDLGEVALEAVSGVAQMGRDGGWYGPEVPVPAGSSPFHRALGLAGRDPSWTPPAP